MCLGRNLKYLRLKHGFSQDDIADMFGYKSYTTIQKWESDESEPSVEKLRALANTYKVSMNELLTVDLEEWDNSDDSLLTNLSGFELLFSSIGFSYSFKDNDTVLLKNNAISVIISNTEFCILKEQCINTLRDNTHALISSKLK